MDQAEPDTVAPTESLNTSLTPVTPLPTLDSGSSVLRIHRPPSKPKPAGFAKYTPAVETYPPAYRLECVPNERETREDDEIILTAELTRKALDQRIPVKEVVIQVQAEEVS